MIYVQSKARDVFNDSSLELMITLEQTPKTLRNPSLKLFYYKILVMFLSFISIKLANKKRLNFDQIYWKPLSKFDPPCALLWIAVERIMKTFQ